jgi:hypothetical protein
MLCRGRSSANVPSKSGELSSRLLSPPAVRVLLARRSIPRGPLVVRKFAVVLVVVVAALLSSASPALAYDGPSAARYADKWWHGRNPNYQVFNNDCTDFVSQSLHNGGYSYVGGNATSPDRSQWWIHYNSFWDNFTWSDSWSHAHNLYNFLLESYPGGTQQGIARGSSTTRYTPNSVVTGDVLFYDWGGGEGISHSAIQVGIGDDAKYGHAWYGNYVDYHTNDTYHAFWSLRPRNAMWSTTTIYFMHISSSNHKTAGAPKK